jgi:hypothetical protein
VAVIGTSFNWYFFSQIQGHDHLSEQELISDLDTNAKEYQKLISMFRDDAPLTTVHPTWIYPENAISPARWLAYKKLFTELGLDAGMRSWGGQSIWFISTTRGLVTGGSSKGYMYLPEDPVPLYTSLDHIPDDLESNVEGYRKITKDWFITFKWDD